MMSISRIWRAFCVLVCLLLCTDAARILVIIGVSSKSHRTMFDPLIERLSERGHEVKVISVFPSNRRLRNVEEMGIEFDLSSSLTNVFQDDDMDKTPMLAKMYSVITAKFPEMSMQLFNSPQIRKLRESDEKFDVILLNQFNEFFLGYVHRLNTPFIYVSTLPSPFPWMYDVMGNPHNPAVDPLPTLDYSSKMTFMERVANTLTTHIVKSVMKYFVYPTIGTAAKRTFGEDLPPLEEIQKNASLILSNSHFSVADPRPTSPNIIDVGGLHCRKAQPLPKDLQDFFDGSGESGVIYFSFGSIVRPANMPIHLRQAFVRVFSRLSQRVLWKWDNSKIEGLPENVKLRNWYPQQDILGHPKTRLLITHGGLFSKYEAVYHGVPMLGVPFFIDQHANINDAVKSGFGLKLEIADLNEENIYNAIKQILHDSRFRENVKRRSALLTDQMTTPLDRAVWWIEYVIRHRGAEHLRPVSAEMTWIQYNLLDVYVFLAAAIVVPLIIAYTAVKHMCCRKQTAPHHRRPAKRKTD